MSITTLLIENTPMVILWILGSFLLFQIHPLLLIPFWIYVPVSIIWFWRFICTYCSNYDTACCPSGYGKATAKLFLFRGESKFKEAFNRNIGITFGYWFIPLIVGIYLLYISYTDFLLLIFIITIVDGFVVLPLISKFIGCKNCPTRETCPWAAEGGKPKKHVF
jgi:hypothetical protein